MLKWSFDAFLMLYQTKFMSRVRTRWHSRIFITPIGVYIIRLKSGISSTRSVVYHQGAGKMHAGAWWDTAPKGLMISTTASWWYAKPAAWINKNRTFVGRQMFCFCWQGQKDFFACGQSLSAALTVHRTVIHYHSPSSPPTHAQNNKRAIAYATTLSLFWQGQKDLNPRPMVLEWLKMLIRLCKISHFRPFLPLFLDNSYVVSMSKNYWCFFDALGIYAVLLHLTLFWCYSKFAPQKAKKKQIQRVQFSDTIASMKNSIKKSITPCEAWMVAIINSSVSTSEKLIS